ncbi:Clp protease N-terminal domain-containing protein [Dactylosporangium sp. NPDC000555]|uniref:Clp protease N-terminal domain-containing protein n=1 Tax=Dactylosporangium sp. NPDC000555 TaxID=3154260 RepID=UPI003324D2F9
MGFTEARIVASLEVVAGLGEAAWRATLEGAPVVTAERLADVFLGRLGTSDIRWQVAPGFGASGEGLPIEVEDEVDATLRLGEWLARGRTRRPMGAMPAWDERVRVALGRALAAAAEGDIRYVGFKLALRSLLAECDSPGEWMEFVRRFHLRPDEEFLADGTPDAAICLAVLKAAGLVVGPLLGFERGPTVKAAALAGRRRGSDPMESALRDEAARQAVRGGCALVGQAHLVMAMCALDFALERTGNRFAEEQPNGGARALARLGLGYTQVKNFAEDLATEPAENAKGPYAADLVRVFDEAPRLAADLGQGRAGTSHLLYVIATDHEGTGGRMLRAFGVDPGTLARSLGGELAL